MADQLDPRMEVIRVFRALPVASVAVIRRHTGLETHTVCAVLTTLLQENVIQQVETKMDEAPRWSLRKVQRPRPKMNTKHAPTQRRWMLWAGPTDLIEPHGPFTKDELIEAAKNIEAPDLLRLTQKTKVA